MQRVSRKTLLSTTAIIATALLMPVQANADGGSHSWDYDSVTAGNVGKDLSIPNVTNITVTGGNGFVEGNADIYAGDTVNVTGDSGATFAYRDNRANITSTLNGNLNSNMQIVIIDKDGLFFGSDFNADVQGILASTGDISASDIMDGGALTINNLGTGDGGSITMNGSITVNDAGLAAFVAPNVVNNGIITASLGRVQMGAADTVTVDLYGDGLVELALSGELSDALLENNGQIIAEGGLVQMSALAAKNTVDNIVNNTGLITVSAVVVMDNKIILSGGDNGTVRNAGSISSSDGGEINISGERFVQETAAASIHANYSDVTIATSGDVLINDGTIYIGGGSLNIDNDGTFTSVANSLEATAGGTISIRQNDTGSIQNAIDAINNTGNGLNTVKVGAGVYAEAVVVDVANLLLKGNNAGVSGDDTRAAESQIIPNSPGIHVTADNVTIDGFMIVGGDEGVLVENANNSRIINNILTGAAIGVSINNSVDSRVMSNLILNTDTGIKADNANELWIYDNDISDFVDVGIHVMNSGGTNYFSDVDIWKNRIDGGLAVDSIGILVENSNFATVGSYINYQFGEWDSINTGNVITNVNDGIVVLNSDNSMVIHNTVEDVALGGVMVDNSAGSTIRGNVLNLTNSGIFLNNSNNSLIRGNEISDTIKGIDVEFSNETWVYDNDITNASLVGIHVFESNGSNYANDVDVWNNRIDGGGNDSTGILVEHSNFATIGGYVNNGYGEADSVATGNVITGVKDGILSRNNRRTMIIYNTISDVSDNGVVMTNANETRVLRNVIDDAAFGVKASDSSNVVVVSNDITNVEKGVDADNTRNIWVYDNDINDFSNVGVHVRNSGGSDYANDVDIWKNRIDGGSSPETTGILVENSGFATIGGYVNNQYGETDSNDTGNVITNVDDAVVVIGSSQSKVLYNSIDLIDGDAISILNSNNSEVLNNIINGAARGIVVESAVNTLVENNDIDEAVKGLYAEYVDDLNIMDNNISNSYENAVHIAGSYNGNVTLDDNILTDNGVLSGSAAARFESGNINISNGEAPNRIINTIDGPAIGLQFDNFDAVNLSIANETLGGTIFEGFTSVGSFYTRFEDGAILDDITSAPIVIDATDVSFDGLTPADTGGILSPADLNFIEDRLYDADDALINGRGQIFGGALAGEAETIDNFEDFLSPETTSFLNQPSSGASLTINGLPPVGGGGLDLNNIEPAAGEGDEATDLANIEPAAGEGNPAQGDGTSQTVTCLSDVVGSMTSGSITYSFGGTFEDSINGASTCSTTTGT